MARGGMRVGRSRFRLAQSGLRWLATKVNAAAYNFIRQVSATATEVRCVASLALRDGGTLEYDYRIHKDASGLKVEITEQRRR